MKNVSFLSLSARALAPLALLLAPSLALAHGTLVAVTEDGTNASDDIALVQETVRVTIDQQYAHTRIRQVFHNRSESRLEGRYLLEAGEGARVDGFAYWNGTQKIVGEVFEKETAAQVYQEVTGLGRDPGLLEQAGEGAFSFRLFPIEPGERKPVEVGYGVWLTRHGNTVEYRLPLGYSAAAVELAITDDRAITDITSSTHKLDIQRPSRERATIKAHGRGAGELVIRYTVAAADWQVSAYVHRDDGHDGYLVATLATPGNLGDAQVAAKDVTLVLDRSGSMGGEPIANAREAAKAVITRLRTTDRLNVIAFDDDVEQLYAAPQAVTNESRAEALAYVDRIQEGGGTNIALALERALAAQHQAAPDAANAKDAKQDDRPRVILFLTDGQSDAQATLKVARGDTTDARVFTIGVGSGVEKPLLARLAAEKRGRFTFIPRADAIERKVSELYDRIAAPVLVGVSVDVQGARLGRMYPRSVPDLFRNDELVLAGRLAGGEGPVSVTIRGNLQGKPVAYTQRIHVQRTETRPWVGRMWAAARVEDLLEEIALSGETDELTNEATELAVAYNFVTPYTSFLAIPESELTDSARDTLASARARKQEILAAHKDAVALSRSAMPPGDPILSVRAPKDARQVTAYFPFGLVKDLTYDADTEQWRVRFLVPKHVVDGQYTVKIVILHADGTIELAEIPYTIDSSEPDFEITVKPTAGGAQVIVDTVEESRRVTVAATADSNLRVDLMDIGNRLRFEGFVPLLPGVHEVRVVVADKARNESEKTITITIEE